MSEVIKIDEETIKISLSATKEKTIRIEHLLAEKRKLIPTLAEFDGKVSSERQNMLDKFDLRALDMRTRLINRLDEILALLEQAQQLGIVIPEE